VLLLSQPGVRAIFVAQRVAHADRARYEAFVAAEHGLNGSFPIRDMSTAQKLFSYAPAGNSSDYLPITFAVYPVEDLAEPVRRNTDLHSNGYA
jgi:hypothetical protein